MLQSCLPVINKVQNFIPDKHTRELRIYVNPMSKKVKFLRYIDLIMFPQKLAMEKWEKNNPSLACPCRIYRERVRI